MNVFRKLVYGLLLLAAGAGGLWLWQQKKPEKKADLSGLRTQLDAAAERNFLVPSLAVKRVEVTASPNQVDALIAKTIQQAEKRGGTAMQGLDREKAKVVMVTLPKNRVEDFVAAVKKGSSASSEAVDSGSETEMVDCEVIILPEGM